MVNTDDNKLKFENWLKTKYTKKLTPAECVACIERISEYAVKHNFIKGGFWSCTNFRQFNQVRVKLSKDKVFKFTNKSDFRLFEKVGKFYSNFLREEYGEEAEQSKSNISQTVSISDQKGESLTAEDKLADDDSVVNSSNEDLQANLSVDNSSDNYDELMAYMEWLSKERGLANSTALNYASSIKVADEYAIRKNIYEISLLNCVESELIDAVVLLLSDTKFAEINSQQHNRFSAALQNYLVYKLGKEAVSRRRRKTQRPEIADDTLEHVVSFDDFNKEKFIQVLLHRFRNGIRFDSIDMDIFRETFEDLFGEKNNFDDIELEKRLRLCGVYYKDKLFPEEGIIDSTTKEKLFSYINNSFSSGKQILYYKSIYKEWADLFEYCYALEDEFMLKAFIEYAAEKGQYYFFPEYMSCEREVKVDHSVEISDFYLSAGRPLSFEEAYAGLSHIAQEIIWKETQCNSNYQRNEKSHYFHIGIFEVSLSELEKIIELINTRLENEGYAIWSSLFVDITEQLPELIENNPYLSPLGIRNAIAVELKDKYSFDGAVISTHNKSLSMSDVFTLYAKHHAPFSDEDIYAFAKSVETPIYYDAIADVTIRVNRNQFVLKEEIDFDIEAIDKAIGTYFASDYVLVKDMDSFLVFPSVNFEWNAFLLESFLRRYSKKYILMNNGISLNNVAGVIVVRGSKDYTCFADVCAHILADGSLELKKDVALNYLAEMNLITRKSYKDINDVLEQARRIRAKRR